MTHASKHSAIDELRRRREAALRCEPRDDGRRDPLFEWDTRRGCSGSADTSYRHRSYGSFNPPAEAQAIDLVRRALKIAKSDEEIDVITTCGLALAEIQKKKEAQQ